MKNGQRGYVATFVLIIAVVGILTLGSYFYLNNSKSDEDVLRPTPLSIITPKVNEIETPQVLPTPTPFPFSEMTIPELRGRNYESSLGQLAKLSESSQFTTYTTSYSSDGFRVNGLLTMPKGNQPEAGWPAVVFVHGYIPPSVYRTESNYVSYVNALADDGLVVFKIDLQGHDDSEGEAHGAYYSEQYVVDVLNAHAALQSADFVDPNRIGLWGHSMGGNVVFRSFVANQEINKVVIWAGAVYTYEDFGDYSISDNSYRPPPDESENRKRRDRLFKLYGSFDPNSAFWKQIPATNYLDDVEGAIQIHHATDDNVVNVDYSQDLMKILDSTNIDHELFEYGSGGHNITGSSFNTAMRRSADFFKE